MAGAGPASSFSRLYLRPSQALFPALRPSPSLPICSRASRICLSVSSNQADTTGSWQCLDEASASWPSLPDDPRSRSQSSRIQGWLSCHQRRVLPQKALWAWYKSISIVSGHLRPYPLPYKIIQLWHEISKIETWLKAESLGNETSAVGGYRPIPVISAFCTQLAFWNWFLSSGAHAGFWTCSRVVGLKPSEDGLCFFGVSQKCSGNKSGEYPAAECHLGPSDKVSRVIFGMVWKLVLEVTPKEAF